MEKKFLKNKNKNVDNNKVLVEERKMGEKIRKEDKTR